MAESLCIGSMLIGGGFAENVLCATSSHFATAERQFRYPLELGTPKPPTGQDTVTGAGATVLSSVQGDLEIKSVTVGRIVDFAAFVAEYPFKPDITEREWRFTLTDPVMECNQGAFLLKISREGKGWAERISQPCQDQISIQTMTTMLMGYKRPDYLAKIGRLNADEATIDMLEDTIEQQAPYISDYF